MSLGARIQELRRQNRLSQEELGAQLGVSRQAVSKWETGQTLPDTSNLLALAELFGVSVDELAAPTAPQAPPPSPARPPRPRRRWLWLLVLLAVLLLLAALARPALLLWNVAAPLDGELETTVQKTTVPELAPEPAAEPTAEAAARSVYIALAALRDSAALSPEQAYSLRQDLFHNLPYLGWGEYGALGEAGRETEAQLALTAWLRQQPAFTAQELLDLQLGCLSQPDGFLAEEYSAILCHAFFLYPVEFAEQLAADDNPPENAAQAVAFTAYGADLYPEEREQAVATLSHWGLTGEAGDWAQVLLQALSDPYGETYGKPVPPASAE